jgi:choline dehydrogenase-like flavoprotein
LAETLAEGGLKVALLERGGEQVNSSRQLLTSIQALRDDCAESLRSADGLTVTTGNCMGGTLSFFDGTFMFPFEFDDICDAYAIYLPHSFVGATSVNHGIFVQERPEWVQAITSMNGVNTLSIDEIVAAYDWVRSVSRRT